MPAKFERCVQHIKDAGQADGVNPWAVCHASTGELKADEPDKLLNELDDIMSGDASFPSADASYKHTGPMVPTKSDHSYENTSEEMLQEIDNMISKDAVFPKSNASYKFTGNMTTKMRPNTYGNTGNETVSIPGSLSAVKIKGKKREGSSMMQETVYKSVLDTKLNSCGCKKKLRLTETHEGGPGSGRKPTGRKQEPDDEFNLPPEDQYDLTMNMASGMIDDVKNPEELFAQVDAYATDPIVNAQVKDDLMNQFPDFFAYHWAP